MPYKYSRKFIDKTNEIMNILTTCFNATIRKSKGFGNFLLCVRIKILLALIIMIVVQSCLIGQTINLDSLLTKEEIAWLNSNRHNIRYAPNPSWIPGDYIEDGVHKGIVSDYIKLFEQKLGVTLQPVYYQNWTEIIEALKNSEVDFVGAIQQTSDRDTFLCFTQVFHKSTLGLVVRNDYNTPLSDEEIGTMKLACMENYTSTEYIRQQFPNAQIIKYNFDFSALMSTSYAETDGTVIDLMTASYLVEMHGITNLKFARQLDFNWNLRFASIKQKPILASILDKLLGTINEEQRQEIKNRWIHFDILIKPSFYERNKMLVWGMAVILVVIFISAILINLYLRNQIRIRTHDLVIARDNAVKNEKASRNLFEKHTAVKLIIDPETGNIIDANKSAAIFYGWSEETLKRMNISQINNLPVDILKKEIKKVICREKTIFEFVHRKADGSLIDVEVFSSGIQIGDKEFLHSIIHDISDKKKTEDKLKLLNRAIEASSASVVITDSEGNIIYINPRFAKLTGYSLKDVIGKKLRILKSGKLSESEHIQLWNCIHSGEDWVGDYQNRKKNGEFYWEKSIVSPIMSSTGQLTHIVSINDDITERKKILEELIAAKDKAEESDRLKSAFLANMSHEIRTPMNGILGFTDLLLNPDLNSEEKENYIHIVHQSGQRMLNTVNDIIEISKIEAGLVNLRNELIDVNNRVEELVQFFMPEAKKKGLKLIMEKLMPHEKKNLFTDKNKLDSILTNLIKNAIKYTESGSIQLGCELKDHIILFYIKDSGIGIPKARQKAIFNRFEQADIADNRAFQGSGLGLAIAKSYVEMLGGKIWVESEEGKGSIFYFTLPVTSNKGEKPIHDNGDEVSYDDKNTTSIKTELKILIVEDDEPSIKYISVLINDFSKEIFFAKTGNQAIEIYQNNSDIDLIFMDIKLPGMNGYEATRRIREFNKNVVIIAQTAFALSGDKRKAIDAGCNDYISKPINKNKLQELIHKHFGDSY